MNPFTENLPVQYLKPGEIYIGETPALVSTVLGSCVAVTMYNPRFRVGAICHAVLPECRERKPCTCGRDCRNSARYVHCSVTSMLAGLQQLGIARQEIEVKIFGGSDMFNSGEEKRNISVGGNNIEKALQIIEAEGLRIIASDVGGDQGRKVLFHTCTGEVMVKRLQRSELHGL